MNDISTTFAAVEFQMRMDTLELELEISMVKAQTASKERETLIYQGLCEMYRGRVHSKTVPTDVVEKLALATEYLEA
jgi:hypothetical protein